MPPQATAAAALPQPVLHIIASALGGGAVHVRTLTTALAQRGVAVIVAMPFEGAMSADDVACAGARTANWHNDGLVRGVASLTALMRAHQPAIVHTHGTRAAVATWMALRLARRQVCRVHSVHGFVTPHHAQPRRFVQQQVERIVVGSARVVLTGSQHERSAMIAAGIGGTATTVLVPQGVDTTHCAALSTHDRDTARRRLAFDESHFVVICVCRLDRPRDLPTVLRAFALLAHASRGARLLVVGDGPQRAAIEANVAMLGLADKVVFAGWQRDPAPFYAAADVFVSASYAWEAFGLATVEAQAAGLPVVVTDCGGAAEAFAAGKSGLLIPARDADALAAALRELAVDPARRRAFGEAGRALAAQRFAVGPMVEAVMNAYRTAVG